MNYYNEHDPKAAAWLRVLISENLIAKGEVDERDIQEVTANDVRGFVQCHFFAGIGGWSLALRLAEVPDDYPVWTGSCPCQPFSCAGKGKAQADERHLWPDFNRLIRECRPDRVFGEQVEAAIGFGWLDGISADLEAEGYAVGAVVLAASSIGAPHKRQRLYWVADSQREQFHGSGYAGPGWRGELADGGELGSAAGSNPVADAEHDGGRTDEPGRGSQGREVDGRDCAANPVADSSDNRRATNERESRQGKIKGPRNGAECSGDHGGMVQPDLAGRHAGQPAAAPAGHGSPTEPAGGDVVALGNSQQPGLEGHAGHGADGHQPGRLDTGATGSVAESGSVVPAGFWDNFRIVHCRDGKARRVPTQPALFPLAHGVSGRVGILRGAGNAIVPQVAAEFIKAAMNL